MARGRIVDQYFENSADDNGKVNKQLYGIVDFTEKKFVFFY